MGAMAAGEIKWTGRSMPSSAVRWRKEYPAAVLDVVFGRFSPVGKLPITLPRSDAVLAVDENGVCISPNDVPGYDKDPYIPDSLKDENGKAYAYRDAQGNYYELNFGLSY